MIYVEMLGAYSGLCLMATILNPRGHPGYCLPAIEVDGQPDPIIAPRFGGRKSKPVLRDEREQKAVTCDGWTAFVPSTNPI